MSDRPLVQITMPDGSTIIREATCYTQVRLGGSNLPPGAIGVAIDGWLRPDPIDGYTIGEVGEGKFFAFRNARHPRQDAR